MELESKEVSHSGEVQMYTQRIIDKTSVSTNTARRSLQQRLEAGEYVICAEGYLFTFTRRGYIGTGVWSPHFVLDYPEVLREAHYDFVRAGTDVVQALQV